LEGWLLSRRTSLYFGMAEPGRVEMKHLFFRHVVAELA